MSADPGEQVVERGLYVYGVVPLRESLPEQLPAVGGETEVELVSHGELSALVSDLEINRPLGTPEDLLVHERVLDTLASETEVLPMRFGAVVSDAAAVAEELLEPHQERFRSVLSQLEGKVQFAVRGTYIEQAHLREVVLEDPEIAELRERLRGVDPTAAYDDRVRLGELVHAAVSAKRAEDARCLVDAVASDARSSLIHEVAGEDEALSVSFLVDRDHIAEFEDAVERQGRQWRERIGMRLIGPLAPYDFLPGV